jgi:hypothetical protein
MKDFLRRMGRIAHKKLEDKGLPIPITADMLLWMFRNQKNDERESIHNIDVVFKDDFIRISGLVKKLLIQIYFEIDLKPLKAEKRILCFQVLRMKPLNQGWIKGKIFNRPPFLSYEDDILKINLDGVEKVRAVRVGNIKDFEIRSGKLWVKVGV